MKLHLISMLAGASLIALAGAANAAQPMALSDAQMDRVTAGAAATANAAALALGDFDATTLTQTATNAVTSIGTIQFGVALGQSISVATAASALFQAAVATHADSAATLP
jgi:ABC-type amino acid transport substrate-binding protein